MEQARHAPRLTPEVFHFDRAQAMIVMEYLRPHVIMRKGLIRGIEYPRFAARYRRVLCRDAVQHLGAGGNGGRAQGAGGAVRPEHRIVQDHRGSRLYRPLSRGAAQPLDPALSRRDRNRRSSATARSKVAAQGLKLKFMTSAEALIHGDLHTGSIMVTPETPVSSTPNSPSSGRWGSMSAP